MLLKKEITFLGDNMNRWQEVRAIVLAFATALCLALNRSDAQQPVHRPRVGLVLSGGGALGFAHIGVLKVLEENHIPVDIVTGTSMGAIVGGGYASGATIGEMAKMATATDWDKLFDESIPREELPLRFKPGKNREIFGNAKIGFGPNGLILPAGFIEGQNVLPLLQQLYAKVPSPANFDELPLPFRAVATDIETGKAFIPSGGDLASIVRGSMSVPGFFAPEDFEGHLLVDGGAVDNFPVDIARQLGAEIIIGIDLASKFKTKAELTSVVDITGQILSFLIEQNAIRARALLKPQDIYILADTSDYSPTSFGDGAKIMSKGEEAAREALPRLRQYAVSSDEFGEWSARRTASRASDTGRIAGVKVVNNSSISNSSIISAMNLKQGDEFNRKAIEEGLTHVYNMGYFSGVQYSTEDSPDGKIVEVEVKKKDWLDQYIRIGASFEEDFQGGSAYRLGADYRDTQLGKAGRYLDLQGEIGRTPYFQAELYEPITRNSPWFLDPSLFIGETPVVVRDSEDNKIAEYLGYKGWGALTAGRELGRSGEWSAGIREGRGRVERDIGNPSLPSGTYAIGEGVTTFSWDSLDTPDFPTEGLLGRLQFVSSGEALAADDHFNQLSGRISLPLTFDNNTLLLVGDFSETRPRLPVGRSFAFGGFLDVSGFSRATLPASDYVIGRAIAYHRVSEYKLPISNLSFFLGGSAEYASLRSDVAALPDRNPLWAGSIFMGIDTPILPTYIGLGLADGDNYAFYLMLGRIASAVQR